MRTFADLYSHLDEISDQSEQIQSLTNYLREVQPAEAIWAAYLLCGRKLKRSVPIRKLREWCLARTQLSEWLFDECYDSVGDLTETIALVLPESPQTSNLPLSFWIDQRLLLMQKLDETAKRNLIEEGWDQLTERGRLVWNKLLTASFRTPVSRQVVINALATIGELESSLIADRLLGDWQATPEFYRHLLEPDTQVANESRPYSFCSIQTLEEVPETLGDVSPWRAEWKWDGLRAQLIRRGGRSYLWTHDEELVTDRYPELIAISEGLPNGTVLEGEILPWKNGGVLPFAQLQKRMSRKVLSKKLLQEIPVVFIAYDLLEIRSVDLRPQQLTERYLELQQLMGSLHLGDLLHIAPWIEATSWEGLHQQRGESRARQVKGLLLKRRDSCYGNETWWVWKVPPTTIRVVLLAAQKGNPHLDLFNVYTFGVWDQDKLVTIAKADRDLTDDEILGIDRFIRANTLEKFGPVRTVKAELVFELAFEGIVESKRHKSGFAVHSPTILLWHRQLKADQADRLEDVKGYLGSYSEREPHE